MKKLLAILALTACLLLTGCSGTAQQEDQGIALPILLYHHFTAAPPPKTVRKTKATSASRFREHMTALQDAGYETVTCVDLADYVEKGTPLPEKPLLLLSGAVGSDSVEIVYPILEEFGYDMTVTASAENGLFGLPVIPVHDRIEAQELLDMLENR